MVEVELLVFQVLRFSQRWIAMSCRSLSGYSLAKSLEYMGAVVIKKVLELADFVNCF